MDREPEQRQYRTTPRRASGNREQYAERYTARNRRRYEEEEELPPRKRKRRSRSAWPVLLTGCGIGVVCTVLAAAIVVFLTLNSALKGHTNGIPILGTQTFTHEDAQQIPLQTLNQLEICDKIGNVNVMVDPNASQVTVTAKKIVHANSQDEADQQFKTMVVETQPPGTITNPLICPQTNAAPTPTTSGMSATTPDALIVNVTIPDSSSSILPNSSKAVDITITVPSSALPQNGPQMQVNIAAPLGNINVNGLEGLLNIQGSTGDVIVQHATLTSGSHIYTAQGNVTFQGQLAFPDTQAATFRFSSESGNIDMTLPSNTRITLAATTNVGQLKSDFSNQIGSCNEGSVCYHGPLNPAAGASSATLNVDVSTGNITIHQTQSPT